MGAWGRVYIITHTHTHTHTNTHPYTPSTHTSIPTQTHTNDLFMVKRRGEKRTSEYVDGHYC